MAELVISMASVSVLIAGMASAVLLAGRAAREDTTVARTIQTGLVAADLAAELRAALTFSERTATAVTFTVADRNSDSVNETIRYAWSGTAGDPLTRQFNGGTAVTVLDDVHQFQLVYDVTSVSGKYYLRRVDWGLQAGPNGAAYLNMGTYVLSQPEVTGP